MKARGPFFFALLVATACGGRVEGESRRGDDDTNTVNACAADALATDELDAVSIAADERDVYWIAQGNAQVPSTIRHRSLQGTAGHDVGVITDFAPGDKAQRALSSARALVLDHESVYWTTTDGTLRAKPRAAARDDDGSVRILHDALGTYPTTPAIDDQYVYASTSSTTENTLVRIAKSDGSKKTLATSRARIDAIAVSSGWVLWTGGDPLLYKIHRDGGERITLSTFPLHAQSLATNGDVVVWTSWQSGTIEGMPIKGGELFELARGRNHPNAISVDKTHATWVDFGTLPTDGQASAPDGAVVRAPLRIDAPLDILADAQPSPTSAVVVGSTVLYTTRGRFVPGASASDQASPRTSSVRCVLRRD